MTREPVWVLDQVVHAVHQRQLAEHGGVAGMRDEHLLSSALAKPRQLYAYGGENVTIPQLAAAYAFGLARNHPFLDGNKRTAFVISLLFLLINGYRLQAGDDEKYTTFVALADGSLSEQALAEFFLGNGCEAR